MWLQKASNLLKTVRLLVRISAKFWNREKFPKKLLTFFFTNSNPSQFLLKILGLSSYRLCHRCSKRFLSKHIDLNSTIFVPSGLNLKLRKFVNSYVVVSVLHGSTVKMRRVLRIEFWPSLCNKCGILRETALISSQCWTNLSAMKLCCNTKNFQVDFSDIETVNVAVAGTVKVALIKCPFYSETNDDEGTLKNYFATKRLMYEGDVFCTQNSSMFPAELRKDTNASTIRSDLNDTNGALTLPTDNSAGMTDKDYSWFKVVRIVAERQKNPYVQSLSETNEELENGRETKMRRKKSQPFLVDFNQSVLFQVSPVHSFVPQENSSLLLSKQNHHVWSNPDLPVLNKYIRKVSDLVISYPKLRQSIPLCILLHGVSGCGKSLVTRNLSRNLFMNYLSFDCYELWSEAAGTSEAKIKNAFKSALDHAPSILVLKNLDILGKDSTTGEIDTRIVACLESCAKSLVVDSKRAYPVVLIGLTRNLLEIPSEMMPLFLMDIKIQKFNETDRTVLLEAILSGMGLDDVHLNEIGRRTPGFALADLDTLAKEAFLNFLKKNECAVRKIQTEDFQLALEKMQADYGDSIGVPKVPSVTWSDIGGLEEPKRIILETIHFARNFPQLFGAGLKRSGVLLYGPPGCGKTLLAKAVASEAQLTFLSVKGPELLNMYVGQSEQNVREVFERARNSSPCVIFFDELDALAPNRGRSGDSGGVMDRVVSQLLSELDGMQINQDLFVIGATNRPDLVEPALLRPGRFDKVVYVGLSEDFEARWNILKAVTRKLNLSNKMMNELKLLVGKCPQGMSGADFYSWTSLSVAKAMARAVEQIENGDVGEKMATLVLDFEDFEKALEEIRPSISKEEIKNYIT